MTLRDFYKILKVSSNWLDVMDPAIAKLARHLQVPLFRFGLIQKELVMARKIRQKSLCLKLTALLLSFSLTASLAACGGDAAETAPLGGNPPIATGTECDPQTCDGYCDLGQCKTFPSDNETVLEENVTPKEKTTDPEEDAVNQKAANLVEKFDLPPITGSSLFSVYLKSIHINTTGNVVCAVDFKLAANIVITAALAYVIGPLLGVSAGVLSGTAGIGTIALGTKTGVAAAVIMIRNALTILGLKGVAKLALLPVIGDIFLDDSCDAFVKLTMGENNDTSSELENVGGWLPFRYLGADGEWEKEKMLPDMTLNALKKLTKDDIHAVAYDDDGFRDQNIGNCKATTGKLYEMQEELSTNRRYTLKMDCINPWVGGAGSVSVEIISKELKKKMDTQLAEESVIEPTAQ